MYQFHKEVMSPLNCTPQDPFGGVDIDLSGVGIPQPFASSPLLQFVMTRLWLMFKLHMAHDDL